MDLVNWEKLQEIHDELNYPLNHTFNVKTLHPTGVFKNRLSCIAYQELAEKMLIMLQANKGELTLLDVGCNKGGFSFWVSAFVSNITGIDLKHDYIEFANDIVNKHNIMNINFVCCPFENSLVYNEFDIVYFGQCTHYMFRDAIKNNIYPLWFLKKAKDNSKRLIIIDGAFDGDPSVEYDAKIDNWDIPTKKLATVEGYAGSLRPEFHLVNYAWSGDGSTRYLAVFERIIL